MVWSPEHIRVKLATKSGAVGRHGCWGRGREEILSALQRPLSQDQISPICRERSRFEMGVFETPYVRLLACRPSIVFCVEKGGF